AVLQRRFLRSLARCSAGFVGQTGFQPWLGPVKPPPPAAATVARVLAPAAPDPAGGLGEAVRVAAELNQVPDRERKLFALAEPEPKKAKPEGPAEHEKVVQSVERFVRKLDPKRTRLNSSH